MCGDVFRNGEAASVAKSEQEVKRQGKEDERQGVAQIVKGFYHKRSGF